VRYAEDLTAGTVIDLGEYRVTEDEMVTFARHWDPQPFHTDWAVIAGRQIREVRMLAPVRPGAVLAGRLTIDDVTPGKPGRSLVVTTGELRAEDTVVLRAIFEFYLRRRAAVSP